VSKGSLADGGVSDCSLPDGGVSDCGAAELAGGSLAYGSIADCRLSCCSLSNGGVADCLTGGGVVDRPVTGWCYLCQSCVLAASWTCWRRRIYLHIGKPGCAFGLKKLVRLGGVDVADLCFYVHIWLGVRKMTGVATGFYELRLIEL
jgi:hypothetical protein